jgi:hypothetical protein
MTLLYTQGFEGFPTTGEDRTDFDVEFDFHNDVADAEAGITAGRTGGNAGWILDGNNSNSSFYLPVSGYSQTDDWIVGFAFYVDYNYLKGGSDTLLLSFIDPKEVSMCTLNLVAGTMSVHTGGRAGTVISPGYADTNILSRVWYYLECKVKFALSTSGSITIKLNEEQIFNNAACNTGNTSTSLYPSQIQFGFSGNDTGIWFDDLYICDDAGSSRNDFLGDIVLERLNPDGAGATTQFTPDTGSNYARVNESNYDGDASYVESNTAAQKDTYTFDNLSGTPAAIEAVSVKSYCKKSDGGTRNFVHVARSSAGAEDDSSVLYPSAGSYRHMQSHFVTDPTTGVAWTGANVNGAQFGYKVNA